jgi:hypothetical protein
MSVRCRVRGRDDTQHFGVARGERVKGKSERGDMIKVFHIYV